MDKLFHPLYNLDKYEIILASGSPRRRELLAMLDIEFTVDTSHSIDETVPAGMDVEDIPSHLACSKGLAYPLAAGDNKLVITADTIVVLDGIMMGKPKSLEEACDMLARLQGKTQKVITGTSVRTSELEEVFKTESLVTFAPLDPREIAYYVEKYRPLDKAGAYGIQEWIGAAAIKEIKGSFYNVMGLPVQRLYEVLKRF